jgi:hypothetical protein
MRKRAEIEDNYARSIASLVKVRRCTWHRNRSGSFRLTIVTFAQETKKTSAKYGEPTTGSLWIAFDRHVSEAGEVGLLHAEFSRKVMADVHDGLLEFYNQKGLIPIPSRALAVSRGCSLCVRRSTARRCRDSGK